MLASKDPKLQNHLDDFTVNVANPASISLNALSTNYYLAMDLHYKLIINETQLPFIISDNPVVLYNSFLEQKHYFGSGIGIACKGLQIFLPISPKFILHFYDHNVYKVGSSKKNVISLSSVNDIISLNSLQFLNANINIYFNRSDIIQHVNNLAFNFSKYRRKMKSKVDEYKLNDAKDDNKARSIIHTSKEKISSKFSISIIRILDKAKAYELGTKSVHVRNQEFINIHKEFEKLVDKKVYKPSQFSVYLNDMIKNFKNSI